MRRNPESSVCFFQQSAAQSQAHGQIQDPANLPGELVQAPTHGDAEKLFTSAGVSPGCHGDCPGPGACLSPGEASSGCWTSLLSLCHVCE